MCSAGSKGGKRWKHKFESDRTLSIVNKSRDGWTGWSPYLEEEVFYGCGDGVDSDVKTIKVDVGVFVKLLEEQVHVCAIARHPGE